MAGGTGVSAASESGGGGGGGGGSGHRRNIKVIPVDGSAVASSSSGLGKPKTRLEKAGVTDAATVGYGRSESLTDTDESSDRDPTLSAINSAPPPPQTSTSISPINVDEGPHRRHQDEGGGMARTQESSEEESSTTQQNRCGDCGGSRGPGRRSATPARVRRAGSLPPVNSERSPSILEAKSNVHRFSEGMINTRIGLDETGEEGGGGAVRKRVSFGRLSVRKYAIVLGDHPDCSCGPPVTIDWMYREFSPVDVDEYETRRPARRNQGEMILPYIKRREILTRIAGHTEVEMREATREAQRVRRQRNKTVKTLKFQKVEEAVQTTFRGLRKLRPGSGSSGGSNGECSTLHSPPASPKANRAAKSKNAPAPRSSSRSSKRRDDMDGRASSVGSGSNLSRRHRDSVLKIHTEAP